MGGHYGRSHFSASKISNSTGIPIPVIGGIVIVIKAACIACCCVRACKKTRSNINSSGTVLQQPIKPNTDLNANPQTSIPSNATQNYPGALGYSNNTSDHAIVFGNSPDPPLYPMPPSSITGSVHYPAQYPTYPVVNTLLNPNSDSSTLTDVNVQPTATTEAHVHGNAENITHPLYPMPPIGITGSVHYPAQYPTYPVVNTLLNPNNDSSTLTDVNVQPTATTEAHVHGNAENITHPLYPMPPIGITGSVHYPAPYPTYPVVNTLLNPNTDSSTLTDVNVQPMATTEAHVHGNAENITHPLYPMPPIGITGSVHYPAPYPTYPVVNTLLNPNTDSSTLTDVNVQPTATTEAHVHGNAENITHPLNPMPPSGITGSVHYPAPYPTYPVVNTLLNPNTDSSTLTDVNVQPTTTTEAHIHGNAENITHPVDPIPNLNPTNVITNLSPVEHIISKDSLNPICTVDIDDPKPSVDKSVPGFNTNDIINPNGANINSNGLTPNLSLHTSSSVNPAQANH